MKSKLINAVLLAAALAAMPLIANATSDSGADRPRVIVMTGEAEVKAAPDQAVVSGGAVTDASTASEAVAENAAIMSRAFAALGKLGVSKSAIATDGFSLNPQYPPYDAKNPQPHVIIGYEVRNFISVTLNDVSQAGAALDALIDAGANESAGVSFGIKNPQPLLNEARAAAGSDALNRARIYAHAVGAELGAVRSIHEGYAAIAEPTNSVESVVVTASRVPTPISAGEQSVNATVTIEWAVK
jgi:uncharacterized protein YggE